MPANDPNFLALVELHERMWGTTQYAGRPSLAQLLNAPIVAVWSGHAEIVVDPKRPNLPRRETTTTADRSFILTCHQTLEEIDSLLTEVVLLAKATPFANRRLSKLYVNQKPVELQGLKLVLKR
ncbi:MAG: hypothetical protein OHK0023_02080 [Anaerolineae bacterium]